MRIFVLIVFALIATPAFAQDWDRYDNSRFSYGIDIPPGFAGDGESDNGDGQVFRDAEGSRELTVWGGALLDGFAIEAIMAGHSVQEDAWNLTTQLVQQGTANFSAVKDTRLLKQQMVLLCDKESYATFHLEYEEADAAEMEPVLERLTSSLKGASC